MKIGEKCVLPAEKSFWSKKERKLNSRYFLLVKEFINTNYSMVDERFLIVLCTTCRLTLCDYEIKIFKRPKPIRELILRKDTRQTDANVDCDCYISITATFTGKYLVIKGEYLFKIFY